MRDAVLLCPNNKRRRRSLRWSTGNDQQVALLQSTGTRDPISIYCPIIYKYFSIIIIFHLSAVDCCWLMPVAAIVRHICDSFLWKCVRIIIKTHAAQIIYNRPKTDHYTNNLFLRPLINSFAFIVYLFSCGRNLSTIYSKEILLLFFLLSYYRTAVGWVP
jgi:hypothetical protein